MSKKITVIDYGVGNILSIKNAISYFGHQPDAKSNGHLEDEIQIAEVVATAGTL